MKKLLLASIFFSLPITTFAVPTKPEQFEKLENEFSLECKKYGAESCAARFISMAACTYVFAVNQGKHPDEAMDISDKLFVGIMRGNKIKPEIMFTEEKNIKPIIVNEVAERTALCKEATEKAVPLIFKETQGNDINEQPELKQRLVKAFPFWYLEALEKIIKEGNKLN